LHLAPGLLRMVQRVPRVMRRIGICAAVLYSSASMIAAADALFVIFKDAPMRPKRAPWGGDARGN